MKIVDNILMTVVIVGIFICPIVAILSFIILTIKDL